MFKIFRSKKGFSLVELIVVIAILGVISAIAIPAVLNTLADSKIKADIATAQAISKAVNVAIVSKNSDTISGNDIGAMTDAATVNALIAGTDPLGVELKSTFPSAPVTQSKSAGTFSVQVLTTSTWNVTFVDGKGTTHTINESGKES